MPGTKFFMYLAMPAPLMGVMPARILISLCRPMARTSSIHFLNLGMLKMHWVCMKSAPASTFFLRRRARNSNGSPNGFSAQPM